MKLKYKIAFMMAIFYLIVMIILTLFYVSYLYEDRIKSTKIQLLESSSDLAFYIKYNFLNKLNLVKTMKNTGLVENSLFKSNVQYINLSHEAVDKKISKLNTKWMKIVDENNPFITQYTNNKLAKYLKKQKMLFRNLYGEIFITNKYGAMIATTGKLTTLKHNQKYWWKECYAHGHGKVFFDDRGFDDSMKGYALGIVVPIKRDGEIIGIIKANINIQSLLKKTVKTYNNSHIGKVKIVRSEGLIVYEEKHPPLSTRVSNELVKKFKTLKKGKTQIQISGMSKLISYASIMFSPDNKDIIFGGKNKSIDHLFGNNGEIWYVVVEKDKKVVLSSVISDTKKILGVGLGLIFFAILFIYSIIDKMGTPLHKLSIVAKRIGQGEKDIKIEPESNDEVGELAISIRDMLENLKKTTASRNELEIEIKKRIQTQKELKKQDEILIAQSKQAAMGEMIGMIAHQWRQPLAVISMIVDNISIDMELGELKKENIKKCSQEILNETVFLSKTIDDFRNFFKPDKEKETIKVQKLYSDTLKIIGKSFENSYIELSFSKELDISINTYANELAQVFINILFNAKDALEENNVKNKKVFVSTLVEKNFITFEFCDNAGGIKEEFKDKVFEPYFSTKKEKNGTGIGLYMCKMIVEKHMLGKIWAENNKEGACFMVKLPIEQAVIVKELKGITI